jgi:lipoyl(octanoyl) transferase
MIGESLSQSDLPQNDQVLRIYLLGAIDFERALLLQRRLAYDVAGDRTQAALILCQHMPLITVGRRGSVAHVLCDREELQARQWRVRWVNRGGGCLLQVPGQLAIYPILPLDRLGLGLPEYVTRLVETLHALLNDFSLLGEMRLPQAGIWLRSRLVAEAGIAVRDWVSYFGAVLNVNPGLDQFRMVRCGGLAEAPMTSLERERGGPVSPALVRQRLIEHFTGRFGFARYSLFTDHALLNGNTANPRIPTRLHEE